MNNTLEEKRSYAPGPIQAVAAVGIILMLVSLMIPWINLRFGFLSVSLGIHEMGKAFENTEAPAEAYYFIGLIYLCVAGAFIAGLVGCILGSYVKWRGSGVSAIKLSGTAGIAAGLFAISLTRMVWLEIGNERIYFLNPEAGPIVFLIAGAIQLAAAYIVGKKPS